MAGGSEEFEIRETCTVGLVSGRTCRGTTIVVSITARDIPPTSPPGDVVAPAGSSDAFCRFLTGRCPFN